MREYAPIGDVACFMVGSYFGFAGLIGFNYKYTPLY